MPACSCPSRPAPSRLRAASCLPAPHEVGVCRRLCPVSFSDFVCLFGFARLLVSAPSRLQACSCPSSPAPSRLQAASCLLHTKSVFVAGYALCLFPTSCVYSDSQDCSCLRRAGSRPAPGLLYMKSVFVTGYALCHFPTSCVFPRPWPRPRPRPSAHAVRGPVSRPPLYPQTGLTSQHAGHAARYFGAFQCHLAQSHVVQGLDALPPRVDVGLVEVTRGYRIGVEQRE